MTQHDTALPPRLIVLLRQLALALLPTLVINLLCAVAVTYLMRIGGTFYENLQVSMCIGLLAMLLINGTRLAIWGDGEPNKLGFLAIIAVMAPLAVLLGRILASLLMDQPILNMVPEQSDNIIAVIVLTFLVCFGATVFFWNRQKMAALQAHASQVEKQAVQAQLQMLQAQIEPHMLFNTLATLQSLISTDPLQAELMLNQLVHYLRTTLSASRADSTSLQKEFDLIKAYLGLMSLRMGLRLSYTLQLPEHLGKLRLAPMLLQPLVENAIRHGVEPSARGGKLQVRTERRGDLVEVRITNTLPTEIDSASAAGTRGNGIALANVRARLSLLHDLQAHLTARTLKGHFVVRISLPLAAPASHPTKAVSKKKDHAHPDR